LALQTLLMKTTITILFLLLATISNSQVAQNVVVEHFTNSRCGICASKNPGFYAELENHPNVIHLAVHPSAPYDDCIFNEHNPTENDDRTNYYGIYGGTPKLVIQGEFKDGANFSNPNLYAAYEGKTTSFSILITQQLKTVDSIEVIVDITKEDTSTLTSAHLYGVLAEAEIGYDAPNGESTHHDVFRKSLFGSAGETVTLPTVLDETRSYTTIVKKHADWNMNEMYAIAILQDGANQKVIQAESAKGSEISGIPVASSTAKAFKFYPNPTSNHIYFNADSPVELKVYDAIGNLVLNQTVTDNQVSLKHLSSGFYLIQAKVNDEITEGRLAKN
jgi:hypothetical protein